MRIKAKRRAANGQERTPADDHLLSESLYTPLASSHVVEAGDVSIARDIESATVGVIHLLFDSIQRLAYALAK